MEILLTLDSVIQQCREKPKLKIVSPRFLPVDDVDEDQETDEQLELAFSIPERGFVPLASTSSFHVRHIRSFSSGCDFARFNQSGKQNEELSLKMKR